MQTECGFHDKVNGSNLLVFQGPTLLVDIGFDPALDPEHKDATPIPAMKNISALVDTGAIESFIDSAIATVLKLPVVDRRTISGSNGSHVVDVYLAQIHIPSLTSNITGTFSGVNLTAGGQIHGALLGRTFLRYLTMSYEGTTGRVVLTQV